MGETTLTRKVMSRFAWAALVVLSGSIMAESAAKLTIVIPRRSDATPVQRLNREGVEAVQRQHYEKAAQLFYKAYLFDPSDPFTLNNLGYISEIQGNLERAKSFYAMAAKQGCEATIAKSNVKELRGRPMSVAFSGLNDTPMQVNRMNVDAMALLAQRRGADAITLLSAALLLDSKNPFTRNNLGVAHESIGDFENAVRDYAESARENSGERVVVTQDHSWRGRPVKLVAEESGRRLQERIRNMSTATSQAAMWNLQGVSAVNRNDWKVGRKEFLDAYAVAPSDSFALNNRGYVAERDGDLETAHLFYAKAAKGTDARDRIGVATDPAAEGKRLSMVSKESRDKVDESLEAFRQRCHQDPGVIELTPRSGSLDGDPLAAPIQGTPITQGPSVPLAGVGVLPTANEEVH